MKKLNGKNSLGLKKQVIRNMSAVSGGLDPLPPIPITTGKGCSAFGCDDVTQSLCHTTICEFTEVYC